MKKRIFICLMIFFTWITSIPVYAADSNIDSGGGGMGQGTNQNKWTPGRDGVRVTVIRISDKQIVGRSHDFSNQKNSDIKVHFGKVSKITYLNESKIAVSAYKYSCY